MPLKVYVSRDSQGRPWPPDHSHETLACLDIVRRLWLVFHSKSAPLAVVANLHRPSADFVIISQHGLGIVEFKHHFGKITVRGERWYAGSREIHAGATNQLYQNPHEQVQSYSSQIRDKLLHPIRPPQWLPGPITDWVNMKVQTAVCFTHPAADPRELQTTLQKQLAKRQPWEEFSILTPLLVPDWVASVRMGLQTDKAHNFEPYHLSSEQITRIATNLLGGIEWSEIESLMPSGEPYGFLSLIEEDQVSQVYGLDQEELKIGRDVQMCAIPIPEKYIRVSRVHARITRTIEGVFLEDLNSPNGTFVDGYRLTGQKKIVHGQSITLGDSKPTERTCRLIYSTQAASYLSTE
jgi:hypothetical protein